MMRDVCIEWKGAINSSGYGVTWKDGKIAYAHRVAVCAPRGSVVRHTCDNKVCVNPAHLFIGTHAENSADMVSKSRQAKGEKCGNSKLVEETILYIRAMYGKLPSRTVAAMVGISKTNVLDIWKRKIWRHV